jgi:hypothetical protein
MVKDMKKIYISLYIDTYTDTDIYYNIGFML